MIQFGKQEQGETVSLSPKFLELTGCMFQDPESDRMPFGSLMEHLLGLSVECGYVEENELRCCLVGVSHCLQDSAGELQNSPEVGTWGL